MNFASAMTDQLTKSQELIARRKAAWRPYEREVPHGFMRRYRKHVRPACDGAVLD